MLASGAELGINRDHSGIVELDADGVSTLEPDRIIEIDNKSLTHRPDLWGHHGMAREVAAITGRTLLRSGARSICFRTARRRSPSRSRITRSARVTRALVFENVTVQPSPLWLQYRLEAIGLNPINNIVDVTNFVMAELAQPMHAFDARQAARRHDLRAPAQLGRTILALNDETYELIRRTW